MLTEFFDTSSSFSHELKTRQIYSVLNETLPDTLIDMHAHLWLKKFETGIVEDLRGADWVRNVVTENSLIDLRSDYALMFPKQRVLPLVFGWTERYVDIAANNHWVSEQAQAHRLPALFVSKPEMSAEVLESSVRGGKFLGIKPYLEFAPAHLSSDEITIFDFLPKYQLEVASAGKWVVILHIPRSGRLGDETNLRQLLEIDREFPGVQLVVAHLGRAYCPNDIGMAMDVLRKTEHMMFDFSANTNETVMYEILKTFGSQRLVFGSDLPVTHMRMRRICRKGKYINLVPPGLYPGFGNDIHNEEVAENLADELTFFLYEQVLALLSAAKKLNYTANEINNIFHGNASAILRNAGFQWN